MNGNENGSIYQYQYVAPQETAPKKPKKRGTGWMVALALCFALLGGVIGGGLVWGLGNGLRVSPNEADGSTTLLQGKRENVVLNITEIETGKLLTAAEVYAANVHSTVGIMTTITTNGMWGQQTSAAAGSGFILTADGYIVTVSTYNGDSYAARVVGYDESNDLAVLKIEATGLSPVVLGSSSALNVGDTVLAIGNPLGELTFSLTGGMVSALDREVSFSDGSVMDLIQTDCAINSGNSGGALFNLYGEVVGITNAKYSGSSSSGASIDNIAFAIPIDSVRAIVESIVEKGYYAKPYIGVSVTDVSAELQKYGIPAGAAVQDVTAGGPAASAGLRVDDVITAIDGEAIGDVAGLKRAIAKCKAGDTLVLTIWRQQQTLTLSVAVAETQG